MKKNTAAVAVAIAPVEIYEPAGRGIYAEGQVITDGRAAFLLEKHPQFFKAGKPSEVPATEEGN